METLIIRGVSSICVLNGSPHKVSLMGILNVCPQCMYSLGVPTKPAMLLQNIVELYKELML